MTVCPIAPFTLSKIILPFRMTYMNCRHGPRTGECILIPRSAAYYISMHQNSQFLYTLNGDMLKRVEDNPYSGVLLSEDMTWHKHISNVTKKASQTLGFLRRNLCTCPIDCRHHTAYTALMRPIMEYAGTMWDPYFKKGINRLECFESTPSCTLHN